MAVAPPGSATVAQGVLVRATRGPARQGYPSQGPLRPGPAVVRPHQDGHLTRRRHAEDVRSLQAEGPRLQPAVARGEDLQRLAVPRRPVEDRLAVRGES